MTDRALVGGSLGFAVLGAMLATLSPASQLWIGVAVLAAVISLGIIVGRKGL